MEYVMPAPYLSLHSIYVTVFLFNFFYKESRIVNLTYF